METLFGSIYVVPARKMYGDLFNMLFVILLFMHLIFLFFKKSFLTLNPKVVLFNNLEKYLYAGMILQLLPVLLAISPRAQRS